MDLNARGGQSFRFLELSAELRLQVYEHLVVVGKIFYSPDDFTLANDKRFKDWTMYRKPELQLLRVSKQIHKEAEQVYLSKNLFVLPDFFGYWSPINVITLIPAGHIPFPDKPLFSEKAAKLLKNISISFNTRVPAPSVSSRCRWDYFAVMHPEQSFNSLTPAERFTDAHRFAITNLINARVESIQWLITFLAPRGEDDSYQDNDSDEPQDRSLLNLKLDFTDAYCPIGCCRLSVHVAPLFAKLRPANVTLRGLRNEQEQNDVLEQISQHYDRSMDIFLDDRYRNLNKEELKAVHPTFWLCRRHMHIPGYPLARRKR